MLGVRLLADSEVNVCDLCHGERRDIWLVSHKWLALNSLTCTKTVYLQIRDSGNGPFLLDMYSLREKLNYSIKFNA